MLACIPVELYCSVLEIAMNCNHGDLAIVVGEFPGCEGNIGRIVQVKGPTKIPSQYPVHCWHIKPIDRRKYWNIEPDWSVSKEVVTWGSGILHPDHWLVPIRHPVEIVHSVTQKTASIPT